ncbi:MAG: NosD domain-containing protein [Chloroflexota bacterium]
MKTPTDNMQVSEDTVLQPGVYFLPNGIHLAEDGITLDGNGALLIGQGKRGRGVSLQGKKGITIKNLRAREYYHGIWAQDCQGLTIANCHFSATAEVPANSIFLDIWLPAERTYGGGILLWQVEDAQISGNDLSHQMNGLLTYHCHHLRVKENLANYCSGFGFHLHHTCDSLFEGNYADFCCRYQPREEGIGHMGADAAGFLLVYHSCGNIFRRNLARLGGDGFFLAGLTPQLEPAPCNDNLFEGNDGSYSPNIAFEATFSRGNIYRDNRADYCNYGFWLGFSREGVLENNRMWRNRQAGIATENGFDFQVRGNTFQYNNHGILLWSKHIPEFTQAVPENTTSYDWVIEGNTFIGNRKAIRIAADQDHGIRPHLVEGKPAPPTPPPFHHTIRNNRFEENVVEIEEEGVKDSTLEGNE